MNIKRKKMFHNNQKGAALILLFMTMVVLSILFVSFMARSISNNRASLIGKDSIQAEALAEAGVDQAKRELYERFETYYSAQGQSSSAFAWFDDLVMDPTDKYFSIPTNAVLSTVSNASYTVEITAVDTSTTVPKYVTFVSTAVVGDVTKKVTAVVSYSMSPSKVFDYSYFVNNYGWFWGGGISSQGDIRSNGDFSFSGNPTVNGDVYGSVNPDLGATGNISGNNKNKTISQYWTQVDDSARPTNPTANPQDIDGDGIVETFEYENGYDGNTDEYASQQLLEMPYLGDLTYYKSLSTTKNGTIKQGGITLVNGTYTGNVVLIGTAADPIEIDGPVVVTGDVLIKGKVKGQGTLYSGRNTHVLGDIEYVDAAAWPKPDTDPEGTDALNATKDFLGLAAKGNIIVGDYTRNDWKTNVSSYLKPPFTQNYEIDPTDAGIGYESYTSGGASYFDGNYTAKDGGIKIDGSDRRFYESSYNDTYFSTIAENSSTIRNIDAVMYTNHAFGGKVGAFTMNGSVVSRDEAIVYSGSITMNYDTRARDKGEEFYLPRALALPHIEYLKKE